MQVFVFEGSASPHILLSYPASSRLGIVQFTVPNEAPINLPSMINAITNPKTANLSQHPKDTPQKQHNKRSYSQTHNKTAFTRPSINGYTFTGLFLPFQDHKQLIAPFWDHKLPTNHVSQDHLTTADVRDKIVLKNAFPNSLDNTGNMPGQYTIRVDSSVPPVQHAQRKVPY